MSSHNQAGASILQKRKSTRPVAVFWNTKIKAKTVIAAATIHLGGTLRRDSDPWITSLGPCNFDRVGLR